MTDNRLSATPGEPEGPSKSPETTSIELKEVEGLSQGQIVFRRFVRHRGAMIAIVVLALVVVLAFSSIGIDAFGLRIHGWWKYNYTSPLPVQNGGAPTLSLWPTWLGGNGISIGDHPLGQDDVGRDAFSRVMRGTQQSLMIMFVIAIVSTAIGTIIGAVAGYYRRWVDSVLMRITDIALIIPALVIGAVVSVGSQSAGIAIGSFGLALFLGFVYWPTLARFVRGEFLTLREREFVDAARIAGAKDSRIIFKHILPNAIGVIIVNATLLMASAILLETALSYLGFGVQDPDVSLGKIISDYQASFNTRPWLFWWPGMFIVVIVLCVNFVGDGLRDAFDPRQKRLMTRKDKASRNATRPAPAAAGEAS